jgi:hypothetical protein
MRFLLVLSALLASLTGISPVARAQGAGIEQVACQSVHAARAALVQNATWRQWARVFRAEPVMIAIFDVVPVAVPNVSDRLRV